MIALASIPAVILVASFWGMYCNNKTYKQRIAMLDAIRDHTDNKNYTVAHFNELISANRKVSYAQHLFALMQFRDPFKLYDPKLLKVIDEPSKT